MLKIFLVILKDVFVMKDGMVMIVQHLSVLLLVMDVVIVYHLLILIVLIFLRVHVVILIPALRVNMCSALRIVAGTVNAGMTVAIVHSAGTVFIVKLMSVLKIVLVMATVIWVPLVSMKIQVINLVVYVMMDGPVLIVGRPLYVKNHVYMAIVQHILVNVNVIQDGVDHYVIKKHVQMNALSKKEEAFVMTQPIHWHMMRPFLLVVYVMMHGLDLIAHKLNVILERIVKDVVNALMVHVNVVLVMQELCVRIYCVIIIVTVMDIVLILVVIVRLDGMGMDVNLKYVRSCVLIMVNVWYIWMILHQRIYLKVAIVMMDGLVMTAAIAIFVVPDVLNMVNVYLDDVFVMKCGKDLIAYMLNILAASSALRMVLAMGIVVLSVPQNNRISSKTIHHQKMMMSRNLIVFVLQDILDDIVQRISVPMHVLVMVFVILMHTNHSIVHAKTVMPVHHVNMKRVRCSVSMVDFVVITPVSVHLSGMVNGVKRIYVLIIVVEVYEVDVTLLLMIPLMKNNLKDVSVMKDTQVKIVL